MGFSPSRPVKANRGVRARVPAAGKVLEGDDKPTLSALYYDVGLLETVIKKRLKVEIIERWPLSDFMSKLKCSLG